MPATTNASDSLDCLIVTHTIDQDLTMNSPLPFWQTTTLDDMTQEQWESLCDGCAQCCAHKLEDEESGEIFYTNIVCQYLDSQQCRCSVYPKRQQKVPDCIQITPQNAGSLSWIPATCAYKRLANGQPLPQWHPLITGKPDSARLANVSVSG
ncbi:MAG: YcgN family cysteine cluster protein [Enterobacterales bacterium]|nr:YcgN family cysteine cluster protein [Enterobacterales bacterium]